MTLKNKKKIQLAFLTLISFALTSLLNRVSAGLIVLPFAPDNLSSSQLAGFISVLRLIVYIIIVIVARIPGVYIDLGFIVVTTVMMVIVTLRNGIMDVVPGMAHSGAALFVVLLINNYLLKEEKNKRILLMQANIDPLTGLYNRHAVINEIDRRISGKKKFYAAYITIENFSLICDSFGHDYGDDVFLALVSRFKSIVMGSDDKKSLPGKKSSGKKAGFLDDYDVIGAENENGVFLGCIKGNDFLVLVDGGRIEAEETIGLFISEALKPFQVANIECQLECRAGVSCYPDLASSRDGLLSELAMALAYNKRNLNDRVAYYSKAITDDVSESVYISNRLSRALASNELHLLFQPQYMTSEKKLRGFETLSRLRDDDGKPISPDKFIVAAEKSNLIFEVDKWVLNNAVKMFKPIFDSNRELVLSVNICARHFAEPDFAEYTYSVCKKFDFPPSQLEIEITETAFAVQMGNVKKCLEKLRDYGIKIALDDFGTGYASLSYLSQLPISLLKIDKSFIDKLNSTDSGIDFVKLIISMGHTLDLDVLSEGVEKEEQKDILMDLGCNFIQGFLWGRPLEFSDAVKLTVPSLVAAV